MEYLHELNAVRQFEQEELGFTSEDTSDDDTADAVAFYLSHEDQATDELMKVLDQAEEASSQPKAPVLICDEALYLRVAGWTKKVSNTIGQMKIAFNSLHSQYRSRVRLEKAKLRRLDERACRRINELSREKDSFLAWQRTMQEKTKLLEEQVRLKEEKLEAVEAELLNINTQSHQYHRQNLRLQRQLALAKKGQTKEETSIKQRPRRCSAPSVLDLTA